MRTNLKCFRVKHDLTQAEIADKISCNRGTYADIESGKRDARGVFWSNLQQAFDVPDAEMWSLTKNE